MGEDATTVRTFSVSSLQKYWKCPELYRKVYVAKSLPRYSSIPMAIGVAGHAGLEVGYVAVLSGKRPSIASMMFKAEVALREQIPKIDRHPAVTDADLWDQCIDKLHRGIKVVYRDLVLRVKPYAVEKKFEIDWRPGWKWLGAVDLICVERTSSGYRIRDSKFGGARSPDPNSARDSVQLPMYSIAWEKMYGIKIRDACLDHYVDSPKRPHVTTRECQWTEQIIEGVKLKIDRTLDAIEAGQFPPGDPFWVCNATRCEFHDACPMGANNAS